MFNKSIKSLFLTVLVSFGVANGSRGSGSSSSWSWPSFSKASFAVAGLAVLSYAGVEAWRWYKGKETFTAKAGNAYTAYRNNKRYEHLKKLLDSKLLLCSLYGMAGLASAIQIKINKKNIIDAFGSRTFYKYIDYNSNVFVLMNDTDSLLDEMKKQQELMKFWMSELYQMLPSSEEVDVEKFFMQAIYGKDSTKEFGLNELLGCKETTEKVGWPVLFAKNVGVYAQSDNFSLNQIMAVKNALLELISESGNDFDTKCANLLTNMFHGYSRLSAFVKILEEAQEEAQEEVGYDEGGEKGMDY